MILFHISFELLLYKAYKNAQSNYFVGQIKKISAKQKNDMQSYSMKVVAIKVTPSYSVGFTLGLFVPIFQKESSIIHCLAYKMLVDIQAERKTHNKILSIQEFVILMHI